ncbi:MAG: retropepsin-like domain-containing protein [Defluviitaleaceae bacterium]|nr:retropepsin-like domain-containing protein [Defluviitaleaceae bacterium]MCL2263466.1 retropepsin-like domain-containing protein [Defluviitaleaceae bacterium]
MAEFAFKEYGRVYVPISIKPQGDITMSDTFFKVDTGADKTTVSKQDLMDLGYDMEWIKQNAVIYEDEQKPTTAAGDKINAGYIQLPLINILGYEGRNWVFQIIMDEDQDFRNLLGRDLLTGFNYNFDNDGDTFSISRTKVFKPRYEFLPKQEINEIATA